MTARELLDRASILEVWASLGGGPLRHGRGVAFWRDGDGFNVSLDETKNVFFDHAHGEGGGVLMLIETVLGCDRPAALRWLAQHLGVELDGQRSLTAAEKRDYARRRAGAERKARELVEWRRNQLRALKSERNILLISENGACGIARTLLATGCEDEAAWEVIWARAHDDLRGDRVDSEIERVESMSPAELWAEMEAAA